MGIAAGIDKAIAVIAPQAALKRTVARQKMQILDSGYGNYGASVTKKSLAGWLHAGGSSREDIEDNVNILRQRSRDLYHGNAHCLWGSQNHAHQRCWTWAAVEIDH